MTEAKDMLISMNDWTEPHYKINTERYLQQLIRILNMKNIKLDLNTIIKYSPKQFKKLIEEMKDNEELSIEEFNRISEIIEVTKDIVNSAMARFATTAESEAGVILDKQGVDIYTVLKEKANILIILDSLGKPELSKQVGRLAVLDAKKAVSKLFGDKTRKFFILDEFNVYVSDNAVDLLNKSRSANVTCVPAFQSLSDLDKAGGTALRNQVIDNCNNFIIMRQNSSDSSSEWERVIGQQKTEKYTYGIEESESILNNKNVTTGKGSMYEVMESKHNFSEIQNLQTGQSIFISKDLGLDEKIKVRFFELDTEKPILEKRLKDDIENKSDTTIKFKEGINEEELKDIENILK
jgi:type IV secretory pathway TraG/TraD family ATPase VirD4